MKRLPKSLVVAVLLLVSCVAGWGSVSGAQNGPPLAQPLVREGDLAVELAEGLMGYPIESEAEAESKLASLGIEPGNGWISDYPVTPDILGEIESAVAHAADLGKISMSRSEALAMVRDICIDLGLSIYTGSEGPPPLGDTPSYDSTFPDSSMVEDYYSDYGPPIVTYYSPPWDYYHLYSWVPYPFWWGSFGFGGYFILRDFHRRVVVVDRGAVDHRHMGKGREYRKRLRAVTNHVTDSRTGKVYRLNPETRTFDREERSRNISNEGSRKAFHNEISRRSGDSPLGRSTGRTFRDNGRTREAPSADQWTRPERRPTSTRNEVGSIGHPEQSPSRERVLRPRPPTRPEGAAFSPVRRGRPSYNIPRQSSSTGSSRSWKGGRNRSFGNTHSHGGFFRGSGRGGHGGAGIGSGLSGSSGASPRFNQSSGFSSAGSGGSSGGRGAFSSGRGGSGGGGRGYGR
ncbi:MAG: hypothetical protein KBH99_09060 [Syntrophobacteraceae bacterium]|nr:hypothetical protein [Syntrophobacteraceae bacterium]